MEKKHTEILQLFKRQIQQDVIIIKWEMKERFFNPQDIIYF